MSAGGESIVSDLSKHENVVLDARILVVGAGGIGCELLKCLSQLIAGRAVAGTAPLAEIHLVDLDSIDITNLNRQFLFRREHVGSSKAEISAKVIHDIYQGVVKVLPYHANIMDKKFDRDFFAQFHVVLNALDNVEARRHVNRLCLATNVPLIDSGSAGFNGQVMPIIPRISRCFDCAPPARQRGFPVCTIRSAPTKPEHCVAWAKYLFGLIFGPEDPSNMLSDLMAVLKPFLEDDRTSRSSVSAAADNFARQLFEFAFDEDIKKQADLAAGEINITPRPLTTRDFFPRDFKTPRGPDRRKQLNVTAYAQSFVHSIHRIFRERRDQIGRMSFDKDDEVAMDFVASAANLRMYNFSIPAVSFWDCESIAGSIIPAVASTNAIVAGVQVSQALRILHFRKDTGTSAPSDGSVVSDVPTLQTKYSIQHVWISNVPHGRHIFLPQTLEPARPDCPVCQGSIVDLNIPSLEKTTLAEMVELLKQKLGLSDQLTIELCETKTCIYSPDFEEDDPDFPAKFSKSLLDWGFSKGCSLFVVDEEPLHQEIVVFVSTARETLEALWRVKVPAREKPHDEGLDTTIDEQDNTDVVALTNDEDPNDQKVIDIDMDDTTEVPKTSFEIDQVSTQADHSDCVVFDLD